MERLLGGQVWEECCQFCGSHGLPPGEGYCEACRPLRAHFMARRRAEGRWGQARRRLVDWTGASSETELLEYLLMGAMMAAALFLLARGV